MKKVDFIVALLIVTTTCFGQAPDWEWAKGINGSSIFDGGGKDIVSDKNGNSYTVGNFSGTIDFDPGPGIFNLTTSFYGSAFIEKLDSEGNFIWVKMIENIGLFSSSGYGNIMIDSGGNLLIAGFFYGTCDFNASAAAYDLTTTLNSSSFIEKIDTDGNFIWVKALNGATENSFTLDSLNNIYITGTFQDSADFNTDSLITLYTYSPYAINTFFTKLDNSGNLVWVKYIGEDYFNSSRSIAVDALGNIFVTGAFSHTLDFDPGTGIYNLVSAGTNDAFILKLDNSGNFIWSKRIGDGYAQSGKSITIDKFNNIYVAGGFGNVINLDSLSNTNGNLGSILKINNSGNLIWAKYLPAFITSIELDSHNNIYLTGSFYNSCDFDPDSVYSYTLSSLGSEDIFLTKLDSSGNFIVTLTAGGWYDESGTAISIGSSNIIYLTGGFITPSINFGNTTLINSNINYANVFITKLSLGSTGNAINVSECSSYTSPSGNYTWLFSGIHLDTIANSAGYDSIIAVNLTLHNSWFPFSVSNCFSYTSPSGNHVWTTSGNYTDTIPNAFGCDSLLFIHVIINSTSSIQNINSCDPYLSPSGNYTWSVPGTYNDTIPNTAGCDSIIIINLTTNPPNASISHSGLILTSVVASTYQWLNCDNNFAVITGATNQTYTATANGNYAVALSQNGCTDTSACYTITGVGINEINAANDFTLYPNPTTDEFTVYSEQLTVNSTIVITNTLGEVMQTVHSNPQSSIINCQLLPAGIYFVQVVTDKGSVVKKVVKQ